MIEILLNALVVFFVVIDPIGLVPIFIGLTMKFDGKTKRRIAIRGCLIAFAIIVFFAYFGELVLNALSIEMPAFRIAGGALLFWIAFEMLFEKRTERKAKRADEASHELEEDSDKEEEIRHIAVFPLAIPLMAGPGAITTIMLMMDRYGESVEGQLTVISASALVLTGSAVLFMASGWVQKALGQTLILTVSRVLGIVLAALATQTVISGITAIYPAG
ncbi:MarC family protein [Caenispirillum salinarum]|uniref:MarC family protein n=1 Tax=Caenispirillum salinarum TaxID=859058 RepID=UPI00384BC99C